MLVVRPVHDDERLAERRCITGIEGGVPLLVFVAEPNNDNIGGGNAVARTNGIDVRALVVVPEFVLFGAENVNAAIITCAMIVDRPGKGNVEAGRAVGDLVAPVGVDFS